MGNCVGKEYYFRHYLIFCYIRREKITLTKETIFPISQFYFLFLSLLLVRIPRDLCSNGGSSAKTKHTLVSALSIAQVIPSGIPWPGKGREREQGWLGGHSMQPGTKRSCPVPAMHSASPSFCQAPQGCSPFSGNAAVDHNDLVSHWLDIHSALLVFKSLDVLTVFLI